jgi:hypothetical protein
MFWRKAIVTLEHVVELIQLRVAVAGHVNFLISALSFCMIAFRTKNQSHCIYTSHYLIYHALL